MEQDRRDMDLPEEVNSQPGEGGEEVFGEQPRSKLGMGATLAVLVVLAIVGITYGWMQHRAVRELASRQTEMSAALDQARSQADALASRLTAAQAEAEAARTAAAATQAQATTMEARSTRRSAIHRAARRQPVDDPRWKQVQEQLGDQEKALQENQQKLAQTQANLDQARADLEGKLQSARTDLGSDIARNHEELVALQKKGERNYYEFDFAKSKNFHHVGPISISLRKANTKHGYCDLEMLVNDEELSRKHINLYEAVSLYPGGYPLPMEVVINHIGKDSVHGYVSEPKYRPAQQAAGQGTPSTSASVAIPAPAVANAKLEHRQEEGH